MYNLFRPLLFKLEPETAHHFTLQLVRLASIIPPSRWILQAMFAAPEKPVEAFGLKFKNPVGLAAGYDKDGVAIRGLAALGFGHLEIGTVTPCPQPGNPKPRVFRLVEDEAIINRMGFPGKGMEYAAMSLRACRLSGRAAAYRDQGQRGNLPPNGKNSGERGLLRRAYGAPRNDAIIGVNLGKNKDTPLENAADDYIALIKAFAPLADYLAINVSSPNTVGLRRLQGRDMLANLLGGISKERKTIAEEKFGCAPILVKIAPDLSDEELDDAIGVILDTSMDGVIATNTTLARDGLCSTLRAESGGLSGRPLAALADSVLKKVVARTNGRVPVIGVGGIVSPDDAKRKLDLGATLVQVYTGMIYAGPGLVKDIVKSL
jgi:dihydroorotate dehydrogenase